MTVLATTRTPSLLPPGRDLPGWHAAITAEVTQHLTAAHAALLARPQPGVNGMDWVGPDGAWRRYGDLPADDRDALLEAVAAIRSDIRRLAQSGTAPAVAAGWPLVWTIPDLSHLYAVAGRPVLTGWSLPAPGGAPGAALDRLDDGAPYVPPPRTPWRVYGLTLALLAVIALTAGLVLPLLGLNLVTPPAQCQANPGQLALLRDQATEVDRGSQLRTTLAALTEQLGRRQLQCPLRVSPQAAAPAPAPHADLPQDRWDRQDVSLLEGCWNLTTHLSAIGEDGHADPFKTWKICFDRGGHGRQTELTEAGKDCAGPLNAAFQGDALLFTVPERCTGTLQMNPVELRCRRVGDVQATCEGRNLPNGNGFTATFQR